MFDAMPKMEYTLRPEDVYHYLMVYSRKYGFLRSRWLMLLITGLLLIGTLTQAVILITRGYQGRLWMLFTALILLCVLAALMYIFYPHSMKLQAREFYQANANYHYPMLVKFTPKGMIISYRYMRMTYPWTAVHSCCESTTHFCFFISKDGATGLILPKSALTLQMVEQISKNVKIIFEKKYMTT